MKKSLLLAAAHAALALSVVAKYSYDRETLPRKWLRAEPVDPYIPLRGRYVSLRLETKETVAFFIPQNAPDPSRVSPNEELWVEVSMPPKGAPRPIRLEKRPK